VDNLKSIKEKLINNFTKGISYSEKYGKIKETSGGSNSPKDTYFNSPRTTMKISFFE
jgi:hypothetical protein